MASIRTAGRTKDLGDLRAVNEIDLDLPEGGSFQPLPASTISAIIQRTIIIGTSWIISSFALQIVVILNKSNGVSIMVQISFVKNH